MHMHEPKMLIGSKGLRDDVIDEWSNGSFIKFSFSFSFHQRINFSSLCSLNALIFRMDVLSIPPIMIIAMCISKTKSGTVPNS